MNRAPRPTCLGDQVHCCPDVLSCLVCWLGWCQSLGPLKKGANEKLGIAWRGGGAARLGVGLLDGALFGARGGLARRRAARLRRGACSALDVGWTARCPAAAWTCLTARCSAAGAALQEPRHVGVGHGSQPCRLEGERTILEQCWHSTFALDQRPIPGCTTCQLGGGGPVCDAAHVLPGQRLYSPGGVPR